MSGIIENIIDNKDLQKDLAEQVRDSMVGKLENIEDIDQSANWWPLAPGWWVIISVCGVLVLKSAVSYIRWLIYKTTWQYKVVEELSNMEKTLTDDSIHIIAVKLSELIKRMAMHRYSRTECASLVGKDWLRWLKIHDPQKFDWEQHGQCLIKAAYAAPGKSGVSKNEIKKVIVAIKNWVR